MLSINADSKTIKGLKKGFLTGILYLQPAKLSGTNLCTHSSPGCRKDCLYYAGRGQFNTVQKARERKTQEFLADKAGFCQKIKESISKLVRRAEKLDLKPCVRLNGTSDIKWEEVDPTLFTDFPSVQFYDYTKIHQRMHKWLNKELPPNYHLTFSRHEKNEEKCLDILAKGGNVAVVFKEQPKTWNRFKVYSGDETDLRFLDGRSVCGLSAKGPAKKDTSGFVV